jgi:hypothetical protein
MALKLKELMRENPARLDWSALRSCRKAIEVSRREPDKTIGRIASVERAD